MLEQDFGSGHGSGQPLCMKTYTHFFTACRIPGEEKDQLILNKTYNEDKDHIIVACRNQVCFNLIDWRHYFKKYMKVNRPKKKKEIMSAFNQILNYYTELILIYSFLR